MPIRQILPADKAALFNQFGGGLVHMDVFGSEPVPPVEEGMVFRRKLTLFSPEMIGSIAAGLNLPAPTDMAWGTANAAIMIPFILQEPFTFNSVGLATGSVTAGNLDVGIYDRGGIRIVSSGSQAVGAANDFRVFRIGGITLEPDAYFVVVAVDDATTQFWSTAFPAANVMELYDVFVNTAVFPLPVQLNIQTIQTLPVPVVTLLFRLIS